VSPAAGVLDLQGGVAPHARALLALGVSVRAVRRPRELAGLSHLVLPGGESTTLWKHLVRTGLDRALPQAHLEQGLALFGTCAGAILLGRAGSDGPPPRFGLLDAELVRNAYGTQLASAVREVRLDPRLAGPGETCSAPLIRAPRFGRLGADVVVLGTIDLGGASAEPVLVAAPGLLAATFHPELTGDLRLHRYFLEQGSGANRAGSVPGTQAVRFAAAPRIGQPGCLEPTLHDSARADDRLTRP
jgi:5'-phosphate synthase pdxT subunit